MKKLSAFDQLYGFLCHIYREGKNCADKLANIGLTVQEFTWFNFVHRNLREDFAGNKLGLPLF